MARPLSDALKNHLSTQGAPSPSGDSAFLMADLYVVTSPALGIARFTNWTSDVTYLTNVYYSGVVIPTRNRVRSQLGLEIDQLDIEVGHGGSAIFGTSSQTWAAAALNGALDGATVTLYRAFFAIGGSLVDAILLFSGFVGSLTPFSTTVRLTVESALTKLNAQWPRGIVTAGCMWELYDAGCGLTRPTTWDSMTTLAAAGATQIKVASITVTGFVLGSVKITAPTSSLLCGMSRTIVSVTQSGADGIFVVGPSWPSTPGASLTAKLTKGCDKTALACGGSDGVSGFNNLRRFAGAPLMPPKSVR